MSETDHDNQLQASEETLEEKNFEKILALIRDGAIDASESGDFLSYSTLLDVQLSEPTNYTVDEREKLLAQLLETLSGDKELVYEIGWDIPSLILPFIETDHDFNSSIREIPCVYKVLKLFEVLAFQGNAKELFLKSNELLSEIKLSFTSKNWQKANKLFEVKLHCLFELIVSCLRKIHTLYPSRFLSMTVSSFINVLHQNPPVTMDLFLFLLKRIYDFARNYTKPPLPESISEDEETLKRIREDEEYLQRKLLTSFITESINLLCKHELFGLSGEYFKNLQNQLSGPIRYSNEYVLQQPITDRLYELSQSYDMNLKKVFLDTLAMSEELVSYPNELVSDEVYRVQLFEKLVVDYQKKFAISIVDSNANQVRDSIHGTIALFTYHICTTKDHALVSLTVKQAMAFGIRLLVPGLVHKTFSRRGLQDLSVFWMWFAIDHLEGGQKVLEVEIASIPTVVLSTYLQCLMFILVSSLSQSYFRFVTLTLITKILSSAPETIAYELIIDSLKECPYENVKAALVQVFKSLLLMERVDNEVSDCLDSLTLDANKPSKAPPLPSREVSKMTKYIVLSPERFTEICGLVNDNIAAAFMENSIDLTIVPTLQAYLNLLILIKDDENADSEELSIIFKDVNSKISMIKETTSGDDQKVNVFNAAGMLQITVERLGGSK